MDEQKTAAFLKQMRVPCFVYFKSVEVLSLLTCRSAAATSSTTQELLAHVAREIIEKHPLKEILQNFQVLFKKVIF